VPLDWTKPNSSAHAAIGIITLPAVVAQNDPAYAGPLLTNPGGPGGAGVGLVLSIGETMQALADTPGQKHFDVVGFDPRGMGRSTPSASCYASDFDRLVDQLQGEGLTAVGGASVRTDAGLRVKLEGYKGLGALCAEQGADGIFQHMSTADVARDMLEFVERAEALKVKNGNGTASAEKPRLQYIGFSYGSQLGNTFASMFPGRVGRMVVDGIVDAVDYTSGVSRFGGESCRLVMQS
jgi:pimeloyl-ACP methyl ester carboxylesterase